MNIVIYCKAANVYSIRLCMNIQSGDDLHRVKPVISMQIYSPIFILLHTHTHAHSNTYTHTHTKHTHISTSQIRLPTHISNFIYTCKFSVKKPYTAKLLFSDNHKPGMGPFFTSFSRTFLMRSLVRARIYDIHMFSLYEDAKPNFANKNHAVVFSK